MKGSPIDLAVAMRDDISYAEKFSPQLTFMADPTPNNRTQNPKSSKTVSPEQYDRLKAEIAAPYRGLRQFIYFACGASGFIGAIVFLAQLAAGREVGSALPNLALQVGVVALMIWLFRWEQRSARRSRIKKS